MFKLSATIYFSLINPRFISKSNLNRMRLLCNLTLFDLDFKIELHSSAPIGHTFQIFHHQKCRKSTYSMYNYQGSNRGGVTWGWVTDRILKIERGSRIEVP